MRVWLSNRVATGGRGWRGEAGGRVINTWEARTCCWRWKGRVAADAPDSPCAAAAEAMAVESRPETPVEAPDTVASRGPMPAAMLEKAPPMANWPGCRKRGWGIGSSS